MNFDDAATLIDPEIYKRFRQAVELGKWPDGRSLSKDQKEICLQAMMLFEAKQQVEAADRVGYIDTRKKVAPCDSKTHDHSDDKPDTIRILH